ncbi:MAG: peptide ABC transporter substrate-binding protein [Gemmatimonadaceae bacterium]
MRITPLLLLTFVIACSDRTDGRTASEPGGTLVIATTADPGTLFPPLMGSTQAKQITEQIYDYLADVGPGMNTRGEAGFRRQLADSWKWSRDSLSLSFHINPRAKWHDGPAVTSRDVLFTFALNKNPALAGAVQGELSNIDSVTARDSLTAVFWFHERLPTQFLDAAAQMLILPAHQLESIPVARLRETPPPPIGSGRFRLRRWDKGTTVEIVADTLNYRGRARLDRVIWSILADYTPAVTRLFSGDADLFDALRVENLAEARRHPNLRVMLLPGTDYAFIQFNLRDPANNALPHPLFGDRELRRALAMSINRDVLVKSVLDTAGSVPVGPTVRAFPTTDPRITQIPFDSAHAAGLLDSLGWSRRDSRGIRTKNGRELAFTLLVPTSSMNRMKMAVPLQAQLAQMGVRVAIETIGSAAMGSKEDAGNFDAALGDWHLGASPDGTRQAWSSSGVGKGGVNYGSYASPRFDAQLESALRADSAHARDLFSLAYVTINADAPAVWLYEPMTVIGLHRRIRTGWMRPDAWWADLADWYIPPRERLLRDRLWLSR